MAQLHFLGVSDLEIQEFLLLAESLDSLSPHLKALTHKFKQLSLQPYGTSYPSMVSFMYFVDYRYRSSNWIKESSASVTMSFNKTTTNPGKLNLCTLMSNVDLINN